MTTATHVTPRAAIGRLRLYQFRNYADASLQLGASLNVISGSNAQGKTNLLEAVATLTLTRSPRTSSAADLIQWGAERCAVEASVSRPGGDASISLHLDYPEGAPRVSRSTTVDGKMRPARSLLGLCPVVMFWPEDLQLVKAGPDGRRRLLDTLLAQVDSRAAAHLSRYRRVLEQRNALLHRIRVDGQGASALAGFTRELTHHGARVAVARNRLLLELAPLAAAALRDLSEGSEQLSLHYAASHGTAPSSDEQTEEDLLAALQRRADEELARGVTVVGPHRDDIDIVLDHRAARAAASQGQQRSIVLAVKIAEMRWVAQRTGTAPVVLLDDVLSELDRSRRSDLLRLLAGEAAGQVLVTTTETLSGLEEFESVRHFAVAAGAVQEAG